MRRYRLRLGNGCRLGLRCRRCDGTRAMNWLAFLLPLLADWHADSLPRGPIRSAGPGAAAPGVDRRKRTPPGPHVQPRESRRPPSFTEKFRREVPDRPRELGARRPSLLGASHDHFPRATRSPTPPRASRAQSRLVRKPGRPVLGDRSLETGPLPQPGQPSGCIVTLGDEVGAPALRAPRPYAAQIPCVHGGVHRCYPISAGLTCLPVGVAPPLQAVA